MAETKVKKTVEEDGSITFEFASGETEKVSPGDFSAEIQKQLMTHGLSQKLGDSYSGEDTDKCHAVFLGVKKNLEDGNWSARSGGGGGPRVSQLAAALARVTGEPIEKCVEKLSALDDDKKKAVQAHPDIQLAIAEIKQEAAAAKAAKLREEAAKGEGAAPLKL